jgi:hypothetical protein
MGPYSPMRKSPPIYAGNLPTTVQLVGVAANRRAAIESIIEADPIATCLLTMMANRTTWTTFCSSAQRALAMTSRREAHGHKTRGSLAGRLRRAQTLLRTLGIEISFSREGLRSKSACSG